MKTDWAQTPPHLDACDLQTLLAYFETSWALEEDLMKSLVGADTFYLNPDPLRNALIFYLGHSAVFYINKLVRVGLLQQRIHPDYEVLFEIGVDPTTPEELEAATRAIQWPDVDQVWQYRDRAKAAVIDVVCSAPLNLPIHQEHPLWALMMGMEHNRIHFETSSMLIRQLPVERVERPASWQYAVSHGQGPDNPLVRVEGGNAELGKPTESPTYGWDSDYGTRVVSVSPFLASRYPITNGEFLAFVEAGGYDNPEFWDEVAWRWKTQEEVIHPKFWIPIPGDPERIGHSGEPGRNNRPAYRYRAMFNEIDLPLDWPVEVNHHEAIAYCRWRGAGMRLMTEAEWTVALGHDDTHSNGSEQPNFNLDFKLGSPSPVGNLGSVPSASGLYDLRGNVWEWLGDDFVSLPGFAPHPLYEDYSALFFDDQHKVMRGGSWASTGAYAAFTCRNWFRPSFYQHAGFRIAQDMT